MQRNLSAEQRLIVAADFKPHGIYGRDFVRTKVLTLADSLNGTGVYLKMNSALRACGYGLIEEVHARGLRVFADLKLIDIVETLTTDGALLRGANPELLTVMCTAGITGMQSLKAELPNTEVLGVTVLTSHSEADAQAMFGCSTEQAVLKLAGFAVRAKLGGLVSSAKEVQVLRELYGYLVTINTPAIRPTWADVPGDDQDPARINTPANAIKAGADRLIVGRPIVLAPDPREATMRTIEEIAAALT